MNFIVVDVLAAIERQRPELADWCRDKRLELVDQDKLGALRWIVFELDARNKVIASSALGISLEDFAPLKRVLQAI